MTLRLKGDSGYVEIAAPSSAGSNTLVLPDGNGTSGEFLQTDGNGVLTWATPVDTTSNITYSTAQATTSGTAVDFTGIPNNARRITLMFDQISFDTLTNWQIQLGDSAGFETSGYYASNGYAFYNGTANSVGYQTGFVFGHSTVGFGTSGRMVIENLTGNTWVANAITACGTVNATITSWATFMSAGTKTLSDTLTQIRLTTVSGTSTFDNGQVNLMYEV